MTEIVWNGIKSFFEGLWNGIKSMAETVFGGIKSFLGDTWDGIKSAAGTAWEGIKGGLSSAWEGIKTAAGTTFETIKTNIGTAWENVKSNTSTAWENIKGTINEKGGGIKGVIGTALEGYKALWSAGFNAINTLTGGKLGDALSTVKTRLAGISSAFSDMMSSAKSVVSEGLERIKGFFSGCRLEFPRIKLPHFSLSGKFSLRCIYTEQPDYLWNGRRKVSRRRRSRSGGRGRYRQAGGDRKDGGGVSFRWDNGDPGVYRPGAD